MYIGGSKAQVVCMNHIEQNKFHATVGGNGEKKNGKSKSQLLCTLLPNMMPTMLFS